MYVAWMWASISSAMPSKTSKSLTPNVPTWTENSKKITEKKAHHIVPFLPRRRWHMGREYLDTKCIPLFCRHSKLGDVFSCPSSSIAKLKANEIIDTYSRNFPSSSPRPIFSLMWTALNPFLKPHRDTESPFANFSRDLYNQHIPC